MTNILERSKNYLKKTLSNPNCLFYYVIFLFILGIAFYAGSLFWNGFTITASGDYVVQDIPFYYNGWDDWHRFFSTGELPFWDTNTALGVDNFSNNTFYYFFNPFFFFCCLFPRAWLVHTMSIAFILKHTLAALFMRLLLKRFGVKEWNARFFGVCYGFGGWMVFYIWFCSYLDVGVFLPLILLGIEKVIHKERPFVLMIGIALTGISNFFFLVPICVGTVIYALFRLCQTAHEKTIKENLSALAIGILGFALGLVLCSFVIFPSFLNVLSYNRSSTPYLELIKEAKNEGRWGDILDLMFNWDAYYSSASGGLIASAAKGYRVFYPLISFFFPASDGRNVSIMSVVGTGNRYDEVCSSLFTYTPTILIFFASIIKSIKQKKISHIIAIAFWVFCLFTPFMYFFFMLFTSMYGRWEILPFTFIIMYSAISFNDRKAYKSWYFDVSFVFTAAVMLFCVFLAYSLPQVYTSAIQYPGERSYIIITQMILLLVCFVLIRIFYRKEHITKWGHLFLVAECVAMGIYFSYSHRYTNYWSTNFMGGLDNIATETAIFNRLNDKTSEYYDPSYYRVQSGRMLNNGINIQMMEGYNGTAFFHSTYNAAQDQYLAWARISRSPYNWVGESIQKKPLQDTFLGVKYYLTKRVETNFSVNSNKVVHVDENLPWDYEKVFTEGQYTLWENKNHIDLGFSYNLVQDSGAEESDKVRTATNFFNNIGTNELHNDYNFLKSVVLSKSDLEEIKEDYAEDFESGALSETEYLKTPNLDTLYYNKNAEPVKFKATTYTLPSNFDPTNPLAYQTVGDDSNQDAVLTYARTIVVLEPYTSTFTPGEDTNVMLSIDKYISQNYRYSYFLIDDEGKTVTYDNEYLYKNGGTYRYNRPLYSKGRNITKIICVSHHTTVEKKKKSSITPSYIYRWHYSDYMDVINSLKEYPLENISHTNNTYSFTTNFDNRRLITLQLGYDKGWSVKATTSNGTTIDKKVYNGNGGWVSFVAEKGETSYKVSFTTKYFGLTVSASALTIFGMIAYSVFMHLKKKNKLPKLTIKARQREQFRKIVQEEIRKGNIKQLEEKINTANKS